jgi:glycosyltransferase involved in cell wall biosynthesis
MINTQIPVRNKGKLVKICGNFTISPGSWQMVPLAFVEQYGFDSEFEFDYSSFAGQLRVKDSEERTTFDFWCPLSAVDGYGRHALSIYKGLNNIGVSPILKTDGWGIDSNFLPADIIGARYMNSYKMPLKIALMMTLPYHVYNTQSIQKLIITQFETDHIPEKHVENVNTMDHLIVTSRFQPDIWKKSGCKIPISVLTSGVDTGAFPFVERPRNGKFKILILGALTGRKNPLGAIRIFQHASQGDPSWELCIKTRNADGIQEVIKMAEKDPRIKVIMGDNPPSSVVAFYHAYDCLLWPSKGEGCGLPPLEAMSTGMELVCSDNSGMMDFVNNDWCYPIKTAGMEPADIPGVGFSNKYTTQFGQVGNWWVPNEHHGVEQLRKCYENWKDYKGKGALGAAYVRKYHNLEVQAESVLKIVEKYI